MKPEPVFDAATHTYTVDRVVRPSVTQILKFSGLIQDRFYNEESRLFGIAVHKACEYLDRGMLKRSSLHPRVAPRVEAWELFKKETNFHPTRIENVVYNEMYQYCGTLDRADEETVVDIKTGVVQPWTALQLAGYEMALTNVKNGRVRIGVELKENGKPKITYFTDPTDHNQFLNCVSNYYWAQNHGIKGDKNG